MSLEPMSQPFDKRTQWIVAFFGLFIAFPILEIPFIGVSITFPIFLWICLRVIKKYRVPLFGFSGVLDWLMLTFIVAAGVSILAAPEADRGGVDLLIKDAMSFFYLTYWFSVYLFFRRWYSKINHRRLGLFTLIGVGLSSIVILSGHREGGGFVFGPLDISQNAFAFNAVACMGVGATYLLLRRKSVYVFFYAVFLLYPMMRSDSRSGIIIMVFQSIAIALFAPLAQNRVARSVLIVGIAVPVLFYAVADLGPDVDSLGQDLGSRIEPYNPGLALLLMDSGRVKERDKSWLVRKTQVDKGVDLFKRYPLTGVGWGHFRYVRGDIDVAQYKYLKREYDSYALTRSSHNTYMQVLAEMGLVGFIPFILIQIYIVCCISFSLLKAKSIAEVLPLGISLLGIAIYFWTISSITGTVWYFVVGLFAGAVANERKKNHSALRAY